MLDIELGSSENGSTQITQLIVSTVSRIKKVQFLSVSKESEKNILNRAVQKNVILHRDENVEELLYNLLSNKFADKESTIKYGNDVYKAKMSLEIKALEREMTDLNRIVAKQKRILKSITSESIFKVCVYYLTNEKASSFIFFGSKNEAIYKSALFDAESRSRSFDKWFKTVSSIMSEREYDDVFVNEQMLQLRNLKTTRIEKIYIGPTTSNIEETLDEGNLSVDDLKAIDETVRNYTEGSSSTKVDGKSNEASCAGVVVDNDERVVSDKSASKFLNDKTTNEITNGSNDKATNDFPNGSNVHVNSKMIRGENETKNNLNDNKVILSSAHDIRKRSFNSSNKENSSRGAFYHNERMYSSVQNERRAKTGKSISRNNARERLFDRDSNRRSYNNFDRGGNGHPYNNFNRNDNGQSYSNVCQNGNRHSYNDCNRNDSNNNWPPNDSFNGCGDDGYYAFNGRR